MPKWEGYDTLEIKGNMLMPGFSIYLLEIRYTGKPRYYYVGMTGDSYFPSARSAFHRISGHLELAKSTQNQLITGIKEQMLLKDEDFVNLHLKMHHFPISGFVKWNGKVSEFDNNCVEYNNYKIGQEKVRVFENTMIHFLKEKIGVRLLNKTQGNKITDGFGDYEQIFTDISGILENG